ncbi:penicillin-binding protein [Novosphingobium sp. PC22D]|uniref:transglycosylase domain-containing protein n=1 Tax=Novosphingobium sp. PC22D TaxID=1962403 RepID=UPI000BF027E9|nr:transglycosylase domain-containing protein [Novosphingobium sp. PC22D]PEQ13814.1 penicillin-binding protein [Novosphingobium sp. PC22D]
MDYTRTSLRPGEDPDEDWPDPSLDGEDEVFEKPKRPRGRLWWVSRGLAALVFLFIVIIGWLAITAPLSKSLEPIEPPQITLLAADGTPIARKGADIEAPVRISELPPHVKEAFIAIEDRRFYDHWGVDPYGIARALWSNLTTDRTQGGSTITQQLAKFTFLTPERSVTRKAREVLIAFWLEAWLSKDEILERYLSNAYFGDNTYGLRAASMHYFYRRPENLKPGQAAMLAGLMQAPSRYAPTSNFDLAEARMRTVLQAMADAGYMTQAEAHDTPTPVLDVRNKRELPTGTYFADWALPEARKLAEGGYVRSTLTTTLDARLQAAARDAIARYRPKGAQAALVAMRRNGEVVAMVGGTDYAKTPFNRATQAKRQPGSTFKLFVYLAALRKGWKPDDTIANTEITTGGYRPRNSGGNYSASLTLAEAFARSSNVAAVRLFEAVGDRAVIATARDLGVTAPIPRGDPSVALGTAGMSLLELTSAYAGVAANSFPVTPTAFPVPEQGMFASLFDGKDSLSSNQHEAMEQMLRAVINSGTGRAAMLSVPNYGKTGTSQDNRDALFVGYAGDYVVGVWIGNDDNSPLKGVAGGGAPARIWKDFMLRTSGKGPARAPKPRPEANPSGPVEPLDVPDLGDIPLGESNRLRIEDGTATFTGDIGGVPIDLTIDNDGVRVDGDRIAEEIERQRERAEARDQRQAERQQEREAARAGN